MGLKFINILLVLNYLNISSIIYSQTQFPNTSFISSYWFQTCHNEIFSLTATSDGGFAFMKGIAAKQIINNSIFIHICCGCDATKEKNIGGVVLHKVDKYGRIEWAKLLGKWRYANFIQTKDNGFFCSLGSRIVKTDSKGNITWEFDFEYDSIPCIKKSEFLRESRIRDIKECKDGSFIALLDNSFSLLKISKDGKPLWLKSTVFDEFDPVTFEYNKETKQWIDKSDSVGINTFVYKRGGGVYVKTSNVYETNDGGYIAIGQNLYRNKEFITDYSDSVKTFFTTKDTIGKKIIRYKVPHPERIYGIRIYPLNDLEKDLLSKRGTTCVIKTDKEGKVLWTKKLGDFSWSDYNYYSNLLPLSRGRWLVFIQDQAITERGNNGFSDTWGGLHAEYYIIDNDGNTVENTGFYDEYYKTGQVIMMDPWKIMSTPDGGFYVFQQNAVAKADSTFKYEWARGFGGWAQDKGEYAVLSDTGVVCFERGVFYKFDKFGHKPSDSVSLEVATECLPIKLYKLPKNKKSSIENLIDTVFYFPFIHFKIKTYRGDAGILIVEPADLKTNKKYKSSFLSYTISMANSRESFITEQKKEEYKLKGRKYNDCRKYPYYRNTLEVKPGIYNYTVKGNVIDLSVNEQLNGLFIFPNHSTLLPKVIVLTNFYGYRDIYTFFLENGEYKYKLIDRETGEVLCSGNFEWNFNEVKLKKQ